MEINGGGKSGKIAIFMNGVQNRLLLTSKLDNVIVPLFQQGYTVDVFLNVIASGKENGATWESIDNVIPAKYADKNAKELCGLLEEKLKNIARLAYCNIPDQRVDVEDVVRRAKQKGLKRLTQYEVSESPIGRNVLRRFASLQQSMQASAQSGGEYDYYLVMRDDSYWFAPLNLAPLNLYSAHPSLVYFKDCITNSPNRHVNLSFDGVCDKVFLFGNEAAKRILSNVYTDFLMDDPRLDQTFNTEEYWKAYFEIKGVTPVGLPFSMLKMSDGIYHQDGNSTAICIKEKYLCDQDVISPKTPGLCPKGHEYPSTQSVPLTT